eukprot:scaffold2276_cov160-Amphora_coffeaeformis.AAC.7
MVFQLGNSALVLTDNNGMTTFFVVVVDVDRPVAAGSSFNLFGLEIQKSRANRNRFNAFVLPFHNTTYLVSLFLSKKETLPLRLIDSSATDVRMIALTVLTGWILWKGHERLSDVRTTASDEISPFTLPPSPQRVFVLSSESFPQVSHDLSLKIDLPQFSEHDLIQMDPSSIPSYAVVVDPYEYGTVKDYAIALQHVEIPQRKRGRKAFHFATKPFFIDFNPESSVRLSQRVQSGDLLVKAASPKDAHILDLTAGLGQDSLLLAMAGAKQVSMVERDPIVATLLADGLRRLHVLSEQGNDNVTRERTTCLLRRLSLKPGESIDMIRELASSATWPDKAPDIVYLDPMFPARKKSASVKKNIQLLHGILESQDVDESARLEEEALLLQLSLGIARRKVVVKRPIHAPTLGQGDGGVATQKTELPMPSYDIRGSINRWDVLSVYQANRATTQNVCQAAK